MITNEARKDIADRVYRMNRRGGYILAFSKLLAAEFPNLTWEDYRRLLVDNGTFCGYAEIVVRRAFGR